MAVGGQVHDLLSSWSSVGHTVDVEGVSLFFPRGNEISWAHDPSKFVNNITVKDWMGDSSCYIFLKRYNFDKSSEYDLKNFQNVLRRRVWHFFSQKSPITERLRADLAEADPGIFLRGGGGGNLPKQFWQAKKTTKGRREGVSVSILHQYGRNLIKPLRQLSRP